jgi:hypothetical protein
MKLGENFIAEHFGNIIHVYMPKTKNLRYASIIPKGDFVTLSLIGKKDANREIIHEFLTLKHIHSKISPSSIHCAFFSQDLGLASQKTLYQPSGYDRRCQLLQTL